MDKLRKQIRRAQSRLFLQRFLGYLVWCLFGTLLIASFAIAATKVWYIPVEPQAWLAAWVGGAVSLAVVMALLLAFLRRQTGVDAAIEIDRRFGLKERVSSSLALSNDELETAAGQALLGDALRRIERIEVSERFGISLGRRALLPIVPAIAAFALATFVDNKGQDNPAGATTTAQTAAQIKKSTQQLEKKLANKRKEAEEKGLKELEGQLQKLEAGMKDLQKKEKVDKTQAMVKLNDLAKDMQLRREKLGGDQELKQQFNQLKDLKSGPADPMAKALKNGDLKKAIDELKKLQQQLANDKLDPKQREQLAQQFEQVQKTLEKMAEAHEKAKEELKKQINEARAGGDTKKAEDLQKKLDKMEQKNQQMARAKKMADQLARAGDCMKQGNCKDAASALSQMQEELAQMQSESDELEMLDEAMDQIADAKDAMNCKACEGQGCAACQGAGKKPGKGMGKGQGMGDRPEEKTNTGFYDSKVKQNVGRGAAVASGEADGPNRKGEVAEEIKAEFEAAKQESADPLSGHRLPREYRDHSQEYFDSLREGQK
jgi:hypothetical protein